MVDSARKSGGGGHCHFSKLCGDIMTRRGLTDYSITHQILWTSLAEMVTVFWCLVCIYGSFGVSLILILLISIMKPNLGQLVTCEAWLFIVI